MRVLIVLFALATAACGFAPMYAQPAGSAGAIGPVQVSLIEGKAGHVLRTELTRILAVENRAGGPSSALQVTLLESVTPLGIRVDESATRAQLYLTANYVLTPPDGVAIRGAISTVVDYEIPTAAFGEIAAQDDARERAAEVLAQRFRAELAMRMARLRQGGS